MNRKQTLDLWSSGGVSGWNNWANEMLSRRGSMESVGTWSAKIDLRKGLVGENAATVQWLEEAAVDFSNPTKSEVTRFEQDFTGVIFPWNADFTEVVFEERADFSSAHFLGNAIFEFSQFEHDAVFQKSTFSGDARFWSARFNGYACFRHAMFKKNVSFDTAAFNGSSLTIFEGASFCQAARFVGVKSERFITFKGVLFCDAPDFDQAHFFEGPRFDNIDCIRESTPGAYPYWWEDASISSTDHPSRWRTLRRIATQSHDYERAHDFFSRELKSQRNSIDRAFPRFLGWKLTWPGAARFWLGLLYQWTSDFGRSTVRPMCFWLAMAILFALTYFHLSYDGATGSMSSRDITSQSSSLVWDVPCAASAEGFDDRVQAAINLSLYKATLVSGLTGSEKLAQSYACLYGIHRNSPGLVSSIGAQQLSPVIPMKVVVLGTIQTIGSAFLIFLLLLALRNLFRIR